MPRSVVIVLAVCVASPVVAARAAAQSPQDGLAAAIDQVRAGDLFRAALMLNDVVAQLSARPGDSRLLARAHAYRALAYLGLEQPERATTAVDQALKADPNIIIGVAEFGPRLVALFDAARRPAAAPDAEAAGQAAERASQFQDAFLAYLKAFQALRDPAPAADDRRLRERIITVVQKLGTKPVVPSEAQDHVKKADELIAANAVLGGSAAAGQQAAVAELRKAIRIAPWWADATFKLATALQKLHQFDEALVNVNLYRMADPDGAAAMAARASPGGAVTPIAEAKPAETKPVGPAVIHLYWLPTSRAMGFKPHVLCDGQQMADLASGRFITFNAPPGVHSIDVKLFGMKDVNVSSMFAAGQEHYVRMNIEGYPSHVALRMTNPEQAKPEMKDRKIAPNDANKTFSADCSSVPRQQPLSRGHHADQKVPHCRYVRGVAVRAVPPLRSPWRAGQLLAGPAAGRPRDSGASR